MDCLSLKKNSKKWFTSTSYVNKFVAAFHLMDTLSRDITINVATFERTHSVFKDRDGTIKGGLTISVFFPPYRGYGYVRLRFGGECR